MDDAAPREEKKSVKVNLISIIYAGIVVKSVKPYGNFFGCNNRIFSMVTNTICVYIIIVRGKLGLYSRTPLIRPPSESHWCGRIRGMVAREGFVYEQKPLFVTRNVVV